MQTNNPPDWERTEAAIWRGRLAYLRPVRELDPIRLAQLIGIERQKAALCRNTERFLAGLPANNALLWGARGTGKSSLIKALLNHYAPRGLRLIQIDRQDLECLLDIVDEVRDLPQRFVIFIDDLSFEGGESGYKALKSALEGSIEAPPCNVLFYATSNRRHLLAERAEDNVGTQVGRGELHYTDAVEEKISLSDRFGLWLSFYAIDQPGYLEIVDSYFPAHPNRDELHREALRFAMTKGSRSGRTAKQFFNAHTGAG
ncbi:ATP-binding protein [Motiliproteus sp. SC1-56]|uniref:ATP-binding protein n=1 Tax=Motiliproteus sp. SC1-56 TaxID=2799565 RepID=UPI001A8F1665|nr:ATP-binding protein [Motiliproteus sp. SC1-56]